MTTDNPFPCPPSGYFPVRSYGTILSEDEHSQLVTLSRTGDADGSDILEFLGRLIAKGVSDGRFTERQAHHDLGVALWVAFACDRAGDYEHRYTALEWLSRVEDLAGGCVEWFHMYAVALMYCGRPAMALEYSERGVGENQGYAPAWLTLGRLRSHFGNRRGAEEAVSKGLAVSPGDRRFLDLAEDVSRGASIEEMELREYRASPGPGPTDEDPFRRLAVDGIVCDRSTLEMMKASLGVTGWSADHPYCTYLSDHSNGSVVVTLMMSEAQLSKVDPSRITAITGSLELLDRKARAVLSETGDSSLLHLFGVSIGPFLDIKLSYAVPGSEDVRTVDFDADLEPIIPVDCGPFAAIVLLSSDSWDPDLILSNLRSGWGMSLDDADVGEDSIIGTVEHGMVAISLMHARVPGEEAEENAANNCRWPDAVEAARSHVSHLVVALVNHGGDPLECGLAFTKVVESCSRCPDVLGVYCCGTVLEPSQYEDAAGAMKSGDIPLDDMVWFGMYRTTEGINAYTVGMRALGRDEMEVIGAVDSPSNVSAFLYDIAYHLLLTGTFLRDGDTLGFSDTQSLRVTRGPGVSVEGMTVRIEYPVREGRTG